MKNSVPLVYFRIIPLGTEVRTMLTDSKVAAARVISTTKEDKPVCAVCRKMIGLREAS